MTYIVPILNILKDSPKIIYNCIIWRAYSDKSNY